MFIQIIQGRCRDAERLYDQMDRWVETMSPMAEGWLGGTYGLSDSGDFVGVVRFESREAAARNSVRPEQDAWWNETKECFDGEVTFHDCDDAVMFLHGGSDDAQFVQLVQGRVSDPGRFREFMSQPMDMLHEQRPDIIGGTLAMEPDGWFTETIAFTNEAAAREGERKEMPSQAAAEMAEAMSAIGELTYIDLHAPGFASPARSHLVGASRSMFTHPSSTEGMTSG